jgi:hypothetical protein
MAAERVNYRLLLEVGDGRAVSEPAPLDQILEAFNRQIATGAFYPGSGRRLSVLSNDAWLRRRSLQVPAQRQHAVNQPARNGR